MPSTSKPSKFEIWLKNCTFLSFLVFIWAASLYFISHSRWKGIEFGDLATLLFGTSSVALFIFSIIIAIIALIGWQEIQKRLARVDDLEHELKNEMHGRVFLTHGYLLGEMSIERPSLLVKDRERMMAAIAFCEKAHEALKNISGPGKFTAINNLIFYLTLVEDGTREDFLLEQAAILMKEAQEHNSIPVLLTAFRAILRFGHDEELKQRIYSRLTAIAQSPDTPKAQREEAENCLNLSRTHATSISNPAAAT